MVCIGLLILAASVWARFALSRVSILRTPLFNRLTFVDAMFAFCLIEKMYICYER